MTQNKKSSWEETRIGFFFVLLISSYKFLYHLPEGFRIIFSFSYSCFFPTTFLILCHICCYTFLLYVFSLTYLNFFSFSFLSCISPFSAVLGSEFYIIYQLLIHPRCSS